MAIRWTQDERDRILERARQLQEGTHFRSIASHIRAAQKVLDPDRQRVIVTAPTGLDGPFGWFIKGLKPATPVPATPVPEPTEPLPIPAVPPTPAEIAHSLSKPKVPPALTTSIGVTASEVATAITTIINLVVANNERNHAVLEALRHDVQNNTLAIKALHGELSRQAIKSNQPPPTTETRAHSTPDNGNSAPASTSASYRGKPRIAIVGPDALQFQQISRQVGQTAHLVLVDREKLQGCMPRVDYFLLTRHCGHVWWDKAVGHVGRSNVIRVSTGGIETVVNEIDSLARQAARTN